MKGNSSVGQEECQSGYFQPDYGADFCIPSKQGYYASEDKSVQIPCPRGTFSGTEAIEISGCIEAGAGYFSHESGSIAQNPCQPGEYQPLQGQFRCLEADPGYFVSLEASSEQIPCPGGTYQPNQSSQECITSPIGTFSTRGSTQPITCPNGGKTEADGARYWSDCEIDSDNDGIVDSEDSFANSKFMNNMSTVYTWILIANVLIIGIVVRKGVEE